MKLKLKRTYFDCLQDNIGRCYRYGNSKVAYTITQVIKHTAGYPMFKLCKSKKSGVTSDIYEIYADVFYRLLDLGEVSWAN